MSTDMLRHIAGKLQEDIRHMSDDMARGTAKDFGDYKYACGIVRGLMLAVNHMAEAADRMEGGDDED